MHIYYQEAYSLETFYIFKLISENIILESSERNRVLNKNLLHTIKNIEKTSIGEIFKPIIVFEFSSQFSLKYHLVIFVYIVFHIITQ